MLVTGGTIDSNTVIGNNSDDDTKPCIVFVGNPGVGKSTMLNGLVGRPGVFRSGISFGTGMTYELQINTEHPNYDLADTPGLADIEMRKQAATEITKLFVSRSSVKIVFVVLLESGRAKPEDITTMELVLNSLKEAIPGGDTTNKFAIIVNKLTDKVYQLLANPENTIKVAACLNAGNHKTKYVFPFLKDGNLEDADNDMVPSHLIREIINSCPTIQITRENVTEINTETIEEVKADMERKIQQINNAHNEQLEELRTALVKALSDVETMKLAVANCQETVMNTQEELRKAKCELETEQQRSKDQSYVINTTLTEILKRLEKADTVSKQESVKESVKEVEFTSCVPSTRESTEKKATSSKINRIFERCTIS